jgi:hypothetical protein
MGSHSFEVNAINMFHGITILDDVTKFFNENC